MTRRPLLLAAAAALLAAGPAFAHPGHDGATLAAGLLHPLSGWDHLVAMVAVGVLAARRGGAALAAWPAAFVAAMLAGYGLGAAVPGAGFVEPLVMASALVLAAAALSSLRAPVLAGAAVIAAFGAAHGYAHGAEAPALAGAAFPLGFAAATLALHALGLVLGLTLRRRRAA